jgi:lipopolysaccharide/colanic/teichoic acid biosynthesis glycosyltransferase
MNHRLADDAPVGAVEARHSTLQPRRERSPSRLEPVRTLRQRWYLSCKAGIDFLFAALLAVPALPLTLLAAALVKLTSRGPAFYTQTRVGQNGRLFTIYKIRTMIDNCESLSGARWSFPGDPRITPVGWVLRATHLDELPQLLNVLKGEMSLIGPRPERPEFVPELETSVPGYWQRLAVRPGVTGLAQVLLPADLDLACVHRKLAHDLYYIRHLTPWMDLRLLLCTLPHALGIPFRRLARLLGIPASPAVEEEMRGTFGDDAAPRRRCA